jgi:hypothetical protein
MLKAGFRSVFFLLIITMLCTCIEPYEPKLRGYENLLVVEGLVTDENASYSVKLSSTMGNQDEVPVKISGAVLFLTDGGGQKYYLTEWKSGLYKTDSTIFRGHPGEIYTLHINSNGREYQSDPYIMEPVPDIDSIYFEKQHVLVNNATETVDGIMIYLDSEDGENEYFRWDFEETWKFRVPNPKKYIYINDSNIIPVSRINDFCWKSKKSDEVMVQSVSRNQGGRIKSVPVNFIASDKSDRLLIQYSIVVKQYSISKKEFDFWSNMKKVNESGGDIFATQPFPVISNIHNINDPDEKVLGYFQVSAMRERRKNILFRDIIRLGLPIYHYPCERIEMSPEDYPKSNPFMPPITWNEIYEMYCKNSDYSFVEPLYVPGTSQLVKLIFTRPECADCEIEGTIKKPSFWIDLN